MNELEKVLAEQIADLEINMAKLERTLNGEEAFLEKLEELL